MNPSNRKAMFASKGFVKGAFVEQHGKYGKIIKVDKINPDGSKFGEVAFTYGQRGLRSDADGVKVVTNVGSEERKAISNILKSGRKSSWG